ncbi:RsmB/NOP family class I SAM-dependent RNA methyltransferase, partial [Sphingomonas sp.]|uniref:RsmB/NOP family class I SAM-dependent RNA methyltransferase n=1 Tax=Sphingomonas sp. TaxID=28214 RepID=UPI0025E6F888
IRRSGERPESGRSAVLGLVDDDAELAPLLGEPRGPELRGPQDAPAPASLVPEWLATEISPLVGPHEWPALLQRAPLDLRVNLIRGSREEALDQFADATPTRFSPWGLRLPSGSRVDDHPAFGAGLVEVQDEGSQLVALACAAGDGETILDLCAGAGGKSLALAGAAPRARIVAADSNRARLSKLPSRAARAAAVIEPRLLNPPHELAELGEFRAACDLVLVDAPCSGSGTWRRNPEGRWRLTPERLDRVTGVQARLLDIAAELVCPGGRLVYAVCSLLSREGAGQAAGFLSRHSSWTMHDSGLGAGRPDGGGRLLTPGRDGTDGFFIAAFRRPC